MKNLDLTMQELTLAEMQTIDGGMIYPPTSPFPNPFPLPGDPCPHPLPWDGGFYVVNRV